MNNLNDLASIVDNHPFTPNALDVYENYTYNLELLIVDQNTNRKFLTHESSMIPQIVNNKWPGPEDRGITIAKTGVSTEFLITDLNIQSQGAGKSRNSKIAGTAIFLDFSITQVGNTNLADTLNNSLVLLGYPSLQSTTLYLKINFLGYDSDGNSINIDNSTKVIPFKLLKQIEMRSETDARGTSTLIEGSVIQEEAITGEALSKTQNGFTYVIGETLKDTLDNFFSALNESTQLTNPTLPENLHNTFKYTTATTFEKYINSDMGSHLSFDTTQNMTPVGTSSAEQVGTVGPMMNIYGIISDIVLSANRVRDELTGFKHGSTHVPKIIAFVTAKEEGYNRVTGENVHNIEFFIHSEKKIVVQNQTHKNAMALSSRQIVQEIFDDRYIAKIYNYLFTGKNDQVIDFNITLDRALAKTYTVPTDWYGYEHFLESASTEGAHLNEEYAKVKQQAQEDVKELQELMDKQKQTIDKLQNTVDFVSSSVVGAFKRDIGMPEHLSHNSTLEQMELAVNEKDSIFSPETIAQFKNLKKIRDKLNLSIRSWTRNNSARKDDAYYAWLNFESEKREKELTQLFDNVTSSGSSRRRMILAEELDDDVISKLSSGDFDIILQSQRNNPQTFRKIKSDLDSGDVNHKTFKSTDPVLVEQAKAKYYEANDNNISMQNASMTIKGDPFWLDGYMSPKVAKELFGIKKVGAKSTDIKIDLNQAHRTGTKPDTHVNYCVIVSGVSAGVDIHDNILTKRLITSLYAIKNVTSSFRGGLFTQTLEMVKYNEAEKMKASVIPEMELEPDILNPNEETRPTTFTPLITDIPIEANGLPITINKGTTLGPYQLTRLTKVIDDTTVAILDVQDQTTILAPPLPATAPLVRRLTAANYLTELAGLTQACNVNYGNSCESITTNNNKILGIYGIDPEDKGKASAISSMNSQLNTNIANGVVYSDEEIATFQIAAGGQLTVTGHSHADVDALVYDATKIRYPDVILEEQVIDKPSSDVSREQGFGASVDNHILSGDMPLVVEASSETLINIPPTPPMTDAEFKAKYEAIRDDTTCVGQCRTKKLMLLSKEKNDATKEQYYIDNKVEAIVKEAKVVKKFNVKTRKLEVVSVPENTLTITEQSDIDVLSSGINTILEDTSLTSEEVVVTNDLIVTSNDILNKDLNNNNLILSEQKMSPLLGEIVNNLTSEAKLNALSDEDYKTVKTYEDGIKKIVTTAQTGHRADLGYAVNVGTTQGEIAALSAKHDAITATPYYFDPIHRESDKKAQAKLEEELAALVLAQPDETITQIATIETAGITKYVPIKNPVTPVEVDKQPIIVKKLGSPVNTYDIILPGTSQTDLSYLDLIITDNKLHQYNEASKIYRALLSTDYGSMTTVTDDAGVEISVKDFSILPPMTYIDANGTLVDIPDPSTYFGLRTVTYNDMNPSYAKDYDVLKEKIAILFPNVSTIDPNAHNVVKEYTENGELMITISGKKFYIEQ